jgi:hypothetical protein
MHKKALFLVAVGCAVVAFLVWVCWPSDYDRLKPSKLGTVSIPERQMTISLFCKSRPRAALIAPYEGEYRILEVAQRGESAQYYDLPDTIPADTCHLEVFWYPTTNLLRFHDSGLTFDPEFRAETILDLEKHILNSVVRHQGRVYIAKLSSAKPALAFPRHGEKSRVSSSGGVSTSTSTANPEPVTEITVGEEVAKPVDDAWTKDNGTLAGTIAPR